MTDLISADDGQVCNPGNMPLWETFADYCAQCNGIMTTATVSFVKKSGKLRFYTIDRVCTNAARISPTPKPIQCKYRTYNFSYSDEIVTDIDHECSCGNDFESVYTTYSYSLEPCARKCISQMDGKTCSMLNMPSYSFYDNCCTSCGGEHWTMNVLNSSIEDTLFLQVCVEPLAATPTPTPTPRPLICNYNITSGKSAFKTTDYAEYECQCNQVLVDTWTSSWQFVDYEISTCYQNCHFKRQGLNCNPFEFSDNYADDCCSECDGTVHYQNVTSRSSGQKYLEYVCTPISKVPLPSPVRNVKECKYRTRSRNFTGETVTTITHKCKCG